VNKGVLIVVAVVALVLIVATIAFFARATPEASLSATTTPADSTAPATAADPAAQTPLGISPEAAAALAKSRGFQYLVSYTDRGFEPSTLSVKKGETVRFTNNSEEELWVAGTGGGGALAYPGQSDCGASALDTCVSLKRGDFWEFTFDAVGTWNYKNNSNTAKTGSVTVR